MIAQELLAAEDSLHPPARPAADYIVIRGQRLDMDALVTPGIIDDPDVVAGLREQVLNAAPFPHLVIENLFNETLLDLVAAEFPSNDGDLKQVNADRGMGTFYRSPRIPKLGSASQTYFNLVHSSQFVNFLSKITGIDELVVDWTLERAGLHATGAGGRFNIHCDFDTHPRAMLRNRFILLTYLNRDWQADYQGDLELWDGGKRECVRKIAPLFGRSVLMVHGERSFHGHPTPLAPPPGRTRMSLATYYYSSDLPQSADTGNGTVYLDRLANGMAGYFQRKLSNLTWRGKAKLVVQQVVPPLLWSAGKTLHRRFGGEQTAVKTEPPNY
jgi:hypothetical protein